MLNARINKDTARPFLRRLQQSGPSARQVVGKAAANTYKSHFRRLDSSRHRTTARHHFYGRAANATSWFVRGNDVYVRIQQEGIAQRYYGGRIRPRYAKALTIATRRAVGKRAREFNDLFMVWRKGKSTGYLARIEGGALRIYFWLVREVNQKGDKSVLPKPSTVYDRVNHALDAHYTRLEAQQ
jgi:hypothetical protein